MIHALLLVLAVQDITPRGRVTIGEEKIDADLHLTREARAKAFEPYVKRKKVEPFVVCYPRDRYQYFHTEGVQSIFDVVFIARDETVADVRRLTGDNVKGVTSDKEAAYALFLHAGTADKLKVKAGQKVTLSEHITKATIEDLIELKIRDGLVLHIEIMAKQKERNRGYMYRKKISDGEGMIFCYNKEAYYGFWMKDTEAPLSAAFITGAGKIVEHVALMEPKTAEVHATKTRALYGLEVPAGWFEKNKVKVGDTIEIPDAVKNTKADPY